MAHTRFRMYRIPMVKSPRLIKTSGKTNSDMLDKNDRKILRELFDDARTPLSVIGKKVRLSKEVVNYRISQLKRSGFLVGFNTVIDVRRLGWKMFIVYLKLKNLDFEEEKQIINLLVGHANVAWLIKCVGNYDLILKLFAKSQEDAGELIKGIEANCKIDEYQIDYLSEEHAVPFSFIYEAEQKEETHILGESIQDHVKADMTDNKILKHLAKNARISIEELASSAKLTREIVRYRIKKMEGEKLILKYRPDTLPSLIGFNWYFLILKVRGMSKMLENRLKTFLLNCGNVTYFYKTVGSSDIEIELRAKTSEELNVIITEIRAILKNTLKVHEILIILKEHKYTYFPDCMMKE